MAPPAQVLRLSIKNSMVPIVVFLFSRAVLGALLRKVSAILFPRLHRVVCREERRLRNSILKTISAVALVLWLSALHRHDRACQLISSFYLGVSSGLCLLKIFVDPSLLSGIACVGALYTCMDANPDAALVTAGACVVGLQSLSSVVLVSAAVVVSLWQFTSCQSISAALAFFVLSPSLVCVVARALLNGSVRRYVALFSNHGKSQ